MLSRITGMRVELAGSAAAITLAVALGWAMHPTDLLGDDRPLGPQMLLGSSAPRASDVGGEDVSFASYRGRLPDYVVGTDSRKPMGWQDPQAGTEPVAAPEPAETREPGLTLALYEEPEPPASLYPSLSGGEHHRAVAASDDAVDAVETAATGLH